MVPLSKSGVRKHRGFESRPLRHRSPSDGPGRVAASAPRSRTFRCARSRCSAVALPGPPYRRASATDRRLAMDLTHSCADTPIVSLAERSPSGLWRRTGNAVWGNPSRVRIPPSPPPPRAAGAAIAGWPASCARGRIARRLDVVALELGEFRFAEPDAGARRRRRRLCRSPRGGSSCSTPASASATPELDDSTSPRRAARASPGRRRHRARRGHGRRQLPPACRPRRPERAVPGRAHLRPAGRMGDRAHDRLHDRRVDRLSGARYVQSTATTSRAGHPDLRDAGHSPGHQSLVVETADGRSSSPARPSTATASGARPDEREGRSGTRRTATHTSRRSPGCARSTRSASSSATIARLALTVGPPERGILGGPC